LANEQLDIIFVLEKYKTTSPETEFRQHLNTTEKWLITK